MVEKGMEYPISEYQNGYSPVMQVPHQSNYDIIVNVAVPSNKSKQRELVRVLAHWATLSSLLRNNYYSSACTGDNTSLAQSL